MKTFTRSILLASFFLLVTAASIQAQFIISDPMSVTAGDDSFDNRSPKLFINSMGDPVVFWMSTGSNEAFYLSTYSNDAFSEPVEIPLNGINPNLWSGSLGPNIAANSGHVYLTFEVYGDAIYTVHSADDGQTWDNPVAAFVPPNGRRATIPTIAVDTAGNPYVAYVNTDASEGDAHYGLVQSEDYGQSFLAEVVTNTPAQGVEVCECCNGNLEVAPNGDVYVGFRNNNENLRDCWLVRSTDGGNTFTEAFDMDETDWMLNGCPSNGPDFAVMDDEVVMTYFSGAADVDNGAFYAALNINTGTTNSTVSTPMSDISSSGQNRPRIAGGDNNLGLVTQENYDGSSEIAVLLSTNGSAGFGDESIRMTNLEGHQRFPDIIYSNHKFYVVYEDTDTDTVLFQEISSSTDGISNTEEFKLEVYPNPTSDQLIVTLPDAQPTQLSLSDSNGKVLSTFYATALQIEISVEHLPVGVYQLTASTHQTTRTQQVVVMR